MDGWRRRLLFCIFALTGFSALALQVVWERVISLHNGVDLSSAVTVVAAFLLGLGVGSLLGGSLADRLGPRRSVQAYALANVGIGVYAWLSIALLYDGYKAVAADLTSPVASFGFNLVVILVPTVLMGFSTPLLVRALVERVDGAGAVVGRLYAVNTLGAAAGAAVCGWLLLGTLGFSATTRLAGTMNLIAAALALVAVRGSERRSERPEAAIDAAAPDAADTPATGVRSWPWELTYAATGAVALGLQVVFFRLVDGIMRSNSYSFAHVLTLYLVLYGLGNAVGARFVHRSRDPGRVFLVLQFLVGVAALVGPLLLVRVLPGIGFDVRLAEWFSSDGFNSGFATATAGERARLVFAYGVAPLLVMALPVFLMGASFPFVQAAVSERVETLGRRTGRLLAANIAGNVAGTLLTGFVLMDRLGTMGTLRLLALVLLVPWAVAFARQGRRAVAVGLLLAFVVLQLAAPSNKRLWAFLHGVDEDRLELAENRSCAASLKDLDGAGAGTDDGAGEAAEVEMYVNGSSQNGYPFDDFHVIIGLLPSLVLDNPEDALAIGMGVGSTTFGQREDPRLGYLDTVELCGGQYELLGAFAPSAPELAAVYADPRVHLHTGDGRRWLLREDREYSVVTVDTLRPTSAGSGALYSQEFYRLVAERLADDGVLAQWVPTGRVANTVASVFPHVLVFPTDYQGGSVFLLAGEEPIEFDRAEVVERLVGSVGSSAMRPEQRERLKGYVQTVEPTCLVDGVVLDVGGSLVNRDLFPRDEYFLNQRPAAAVASVC